MEPLPPLRLRPEYRRRLWGADGLPAWLGEPEPPGEEPVAEAWLAHGESRVVGGPFADARLADMIERHGPAIVGSAALARYGAVMPLLVKFLDAADDLSVQVHPDDAYAARRHPGSGHLGKTESWRVLRAEPGAEVIWGFERPVDETEVRAALAEDRLAALLRRVPVEEGDVVHNPAGTVHAVGAGLRIYELQQASDLTYRLWDHGRRGADGLPRELHVDDALAVADLSGRGEPHPQEHPAATSGRPWTERVRCPFYLLEEATVDGVLDEATEPDAMHVITVLAGRFELSDGARSDAAATAMALPEGATVLVPAATGPYRIAGRGTLVRGRPRGGTA